MSQAVLSPNLTKKFQWEVSQIAEKEIADRYPIRWFKCKLKPPKKGEENVDDNRNEEVTDRGNQKDENVDDNRNEEVTDRGNQEGEENDENSNEEVSDRGVANTDSGEQECRYQCKFCVHSFDVYSAYIIHVKSKHEGWRDSQLAENIQDRLDAQAQAESEQSDSVPVYDEIDWEERELVE